MALVTVMLVGVVAGCGGDGDVTTTAAAPTTTTPPEPERVEVPKLIGKPAKRAKSLLEDADLDVAVKRAFSDEDEGRVFDQDPRAGREVEPGTLVTLRISKGPKPAPPPEDPYGTLGTSSIGPVSIGMTEEEIRGLFGDPDRTEEVNFGGGPAPQLNWVWELPDGTVTLKFHTSTGRLASYDVTSPSLTTASGVGVGSSIAPVEERYGDQLEPHPIGTGAIVLSEDEPGSSPGLIFQLEGETITQISGGELVQPAGE